MFGWWGVFKGGFFIMSLIYFFLSLEINVFGSIVYIYIFLWFDCKEINKKNKCKRYINRVFLVLVSYLIEV